MKILSLSTCPLDPLLGSGKTRLRWTEGLRELGHTVDVAEPRDYETWHGMRRAFRFRQAWGARSFVNQKLESGSYDLIEFFGAEFGLVTRQLSKLNERPFIVAHTDGLEMLASERERAYNPPRSLGARTHAWYWTHTHERLSRAAFDYADAFVTGSELDRKYVVEHRIFEPERTAVVEPGLDDEYLALAFIEKKEHRVAYTGSWIARKGIEKLTAVMIDVLTRDRELRFDVYSGGDRERVLACFPTALHDRIEVYDRMHAEQLARAMARAKVFFFPSQYEGFGMVLSEAMACSCAVVTTPTGFGAELGDGVEALVCGFDDIDAMKQGVGALLRDEEMRLSIARAGWERVRMLRWDSNVRKLEAMYERWCSEWKRHSSRGANLHPPASITLNRLRSDFMTLTAIIPRLPPVVDGIGDYALCLARLLRDNVGITTRFIVGDPAWKGPDNLGGFEVSRMTSHSSDELLNLLSADSSIDAQVLLHYEGYGYATRGCPSWLVDALERWRLASGRRSLMTMFHELYASGPPWTSSFWLSPVQKSLTTRLARLSDDWSTSLESYARVVQQMTGKSSSKPNHLAVFSSIGEPHSVPPLKDRRRRMVVFGTRGRRIEVYKRSAADLNRICAALGIAEIVDIGRSVEFTISKVVDVPVVTCGELPGSEVSELLLDAVAGVIDYPVSMLAKSTIFAAYCSHRMIPIVANDGDARPADGLETGAQYWINDIDVKVVSLTAAQVIADRAFDWYQSHNLAVHAGTIAARLRTKSVGAG